MLIRSSLIVLIAFSLRTRAKNRRGQPISRSFDLFPYSACRLIEMNRERSVLRRFILEASDRLAEQDSFDACIAHTHLAEKDRRYRSGHSFSRTSRSPKPSTACCPERLPHDLTRWDSHLDSHYRSHIGAVSLFHFGLRLYSPVFSGILQKESPESGDSLRS